MRRPRGDDGVAGVLVLTLAVALAALGALLATLGAVAVARHRAAGVADLAALAGAQSALSGPAAACAAAERIAAAGIATVLDCRVDGDQVEVVVEVRPPGPLGGLGVATSRARAGPLVSGSRTSRAG